MISISFICFFRSQVYYAVVNIWTINICPKSSTKITKKQLSREQRRVLHSSDRNFKGSSKDNSNKLPQACLTKIYSLLFHFFHSFMYKLWATVVVSCCERQWFQMWSHDLPKRRVTLITNSPVQPRQASRSRWQILPSPAIPGLLPVGHIQWARRLHLNDQINEKTAIRKNRSPKQSNISSR